MEDFVLEYIRDKKIIDVNFEEEYKINIYFDDSNKYLILFADSDCCSESWFEFNNGDIEQILYKKIKNIEIKTPDEELPPSGRQEVDQNQLIKMTLDVINQTEYVDNQCNDDNFIINIPEECMKYKVQLSTESEEEFEFLLRNSSNGYYSGWLRMFLDEIKI